MDPFALNILGTANLVSSPDNKTLNNAPVEEGTEGEPEDVLDLPMSDKELLDLKVDYENKSNAYLPKVKRRQDVNKLYYEGTQKSAAGNTTGARVVPNNLIFEATETYIPQALAKNPEPVVWSDNTDEGKSASNDIKTMLQYHADTLFLRRKLGVMVRQNGVYLIGILKHGWDEKQVNGHTVGEIKTQTRKPQNFIFDPDGYVDEGGSFVGSFLGERIQTTAKDLIDQFPKHKEYILEKANQKLGTQVVYTEWWNDDFCFSTFMDVVLDKHKNEFFNYDVTNKSTDILGNETKTVTPAKNHFISPKMPFTFLSVFSLQEGPHDITSLIEQSIPNQDRINERDMQITKNLASANNSVILSGQAFTSQTAGQAVQSFYEEGFLLVPNGQVEQSVKRLPANDIPESVFKAQESDMLNLRSIYGTQGLSSQPANENTTARGQILNQSHDSTRIGGGVGDALEQVADNVFNWWLQLYYVFYDLPHYGAIMGNGRAVEYVGLVNSNINRNFVVSVSPDSMKPKDEVTEQNLAMQLAEGGWLDPISLFKKLDYPDPMETAKMVTLWKINPQQYMASFFPENPQPMQPPGAPPGAPPGEAPMGATPESPPETLAAPLAPDSLSRVPLNSPALPQ